ncbi:MAG: SMC-Scp complex subunit ScpB [Propionibacteriaceae bacterium]|jgi:segregation and condensation protein B|nr:SMC-Scp complex subunit ScpB [Propionibacteriaceae bacterium]
MTEPADGAKPDRPAPEEGQGGAGEPAAVRAGSAGEGRPELPPERVPAAVEALLIMATEPVSEAELAAALAVPEEAVAAATAELASFYAETGRGFELRRIGAGWRYYTHPDLAAVIGASVLAGQHGRLTQAALETLAVIAYLQPISRSRIAAVRGVNVDGVVRTLLARDLVAEAGHDGVTGAGLLATTDYFLERMGLADLSELPPLAPNLPDAAALDAELASVLSAAVGPAATFEAVSDQVDSSEAASGRVDPSDVGSGLADLSEVVGGPDEPEPSAVVSDGSGPAGEDQAFSQESEVHHG